MRMLAFSIVLAAFAPVARAEPREDARFIVNHLIETGLAPHVRTGIARGYASHHADWLSARSATIEDADRFIAMMPREPIEKYVAHFHELVAERCMAKFSDEELRAAADDIRRTPERPEVEEGEGLVIDLADPEQGLAQMKRELEQVNAALTELTEDPRAKVELAGGMCILVTIAGYGHALATSPKVKPDPAADGLAAIIETPGLVGFPNRIVRQSILRELRELRDGEQPRAGSAIGGAFGGTSRAATPRQGTGARFVRPPSTQAGDGKG